MRRSAFACGVAAALLAGGAAEAAGCRLALSLGIDVSSSVDEREYGLLTRGLAAALTATEVREAFLATPGAPVKLQIFEWSGWQQQVVRQDWVTIESDADLDAVAGRLLSEPRSFNQYPTALGFALLFGGKQLAQRGDCERHTLDVSGDGTNNDGVAPEVARRDFPLDGVTVNGLVVGTNMVPLGRYYQQFVVQGPGAFVEAAADYGDFADAMQRKLLRELGVLEVSRADP